MYAKILLTVAAALVGAALVALNLYYLRVDIPEVDVERIRRRTLAAIVSGSGTVEPQRSVNISSSVRGQVTHMAVDEGDRVVAGQFLVQIDPESRQAVVDGEIASLRVAESGLDLARVAVETARVNLARARETLERQRALWELRLVSREDYDEARRDVELEETELGARMVEVATAQQRVEQERAQLDSAEHDLTQVTVTAPIDGVVTRRNIEQGETVVIGTMNNPGTVLLTISDFSILEAHVEVDETDIPSVGLGQATKIAIDALPDRTYFGVVTEIGSSPIQGNVGGSRATSFRVVVALDGDIPGVRPGFSATADITTAARTNVVAVPIQSTTVRETNIVPNGQFGEPEEEEGVFVVRGDRVWFVQIETGIAGDRYVEALSGLVAGDLVVTGPFDVVRTLADGDTVRVNERAAGH